MQDRQNPEPPPLSPKTNQPRCVLTKMQAREIFGYKIGHGFESGRIASAYLSNKFKISPKAIRDIWTGRSWLETTYDLWVDGSRPARRVLGRPKGKKDSKPRKSRSSQQDSQGEQGTGTSLPTALRPMCTSNIHIEHQIRDSFSCPQHIINHSALLFQHILPEMSILDSLPFMPIQLPSIHSVRLLCLTDNAS